MVELWRVVAGAVAVVLGLAWIAYPTRMSQLQTRVLYLGYVDDDFEQSENEELVGRIAGAILAVLGAAVAFGVAL